MVELDKRYHADLLAVKLGDEIRTRLPFPLVDFLKGIEAEANPQVQLQGFCLSLIPTTFQYFALLLGSKYLMSGSPPTRDVTSDLWTMVQRPGPGKWVGFVRDATAYFRDAEPDSRGTPVCHRSPASKQMFERYPWLCERHLGRTK